MFNWLQAGIVAAVTAMISYGVHSIDVSWIKARQEIALEDQRRSIIEQCSTAARTAEGVSREYQNQLAGLNRQLERLRSRTTCVPVTPRPPGYNAAAGQPKPVAEGTIYDLAGEGEKYRLQLIGCQEFVRKVWGSN